MNELDQRWQRVIDTMLALIQQARSDIPRPTGVELVIRQGVNDYVQFEYQFPAPAASDGATGAEGDGR